MSTTSSTAGGPSGGGRTPPRTRPVPLVFGILLGLVGVPLLVAGLGLGWALATQRDDDGFFTTPRHELTTETSALTSPVLDLGPFGDDEWWADEDLATVRLSARSADGPVFVGIAPTDDVERYLAPAAHDELASLSTDPFAYSLTRRGGDGTLSGAPQDQDFWSAQASGSGTQTLEWDAEPGTYTAVIMGVDTTPGLTVDVSAGGRIGLLAPLAWALVVVGLVVVLGGAGLIIWAASPGPRDGAAPGAAAPRPSPAGSPTPSPVTLTGVQDAELSRWLWLVKWLLAIPHFLVLAVLWVVFVVLTLVAWVAILVTGRYPRALFDLDVGILRWSWRVQFYATNALGTDRYPPFSLAPSADYPADLDVAYPEQLSRGLVLVKSWLLALPQLLIIGILAGAWTFGDDEGLRLTVGGLIGALTFAAGLLLLFTGRYPPALFDVIVGLDRWVYRVVAYVALMTDDYPPFRLDQGPTEPGAMPVGPSGDRPSPLRDPQGVR